MKEAVNNGIVSGLPEDVRIPAMFHAEQTFPRDIPTALPVPFWLPPWSRLLRQMISVPSVCASVHAMESMKKICGSCVLPTAFISAGSCCRRHTMRMFWQGNIPDWKHWMHPLNWYLMKRGILQRQSDTDHADSFLGEMICFIWNWNMQNETHEIILWKKNTLFGLYKIEVIFTNC